VVFKSVKRSVVLIYVLAILTETFIIPWCNGHFMSFPVYTCLLPALYIIGMEILWGDPREVTYHGEVPESSEKK
jgi:hypothetical protein